MSTQPNTRHAAKYDAEQTRESDVQAMRTLERECSRHGHASCIYCDTTRFDDLIATVRAMTAGAGEVQSLAFLTAARMLAGDTQRNVSRAARVGVKQARAMLSVYSAREHVSSETLQRFFEPVESVESDEYAAEKQTDRMRGAGLSSMTAPAADAWLNVTRRDVVTDAFHLFCDSHDVTRAAGASSRIVSVACRISSPHGAVWQDSLRAYMRHACADCTGRGRRPSLNGILAHTREIPSGHADAWALRRLFNRALAVAAPELGTLWAQYVDAARPGRVWTKRAILVALRNARRDAARAVAQRRDDIAARAPLTRRGHVTTRVVETVPVAMSARVAAPIWETRPNDWTGTEARVWDMLADDVTARLAWQHVWATDNATREEWRAALRATLATDRVAELPRGHAGRNGREGMSVTIAPRLASPVVRDELPAIGRARVGTAPAVPARTVQVTRAAEHVTTHDVAMPERDDETGDLYGVVVDTVTVRTRNGETYSRPMTDAEIGACGNVRAVEARYDGEEYGQTSGRTNKPDARGNVASRKPPVPRKRGTRGATGSVVSAGMPPRDSEHVGKGKGKGA